MFKQQVYYKNKLHTTTSIAMCRETTAHNGADFEPKIPERVS